jgi:hypothetical protein
LQRQLNVFADAIIDVDRRRVERDLARAPVERDREIDLELALARKRLIGDGCPQRIALAESSRKFTLFRK